jgi:hypothetical protein
MPRRAFGLLFAFRMILAWTLSLAQAPGDIGSDAEIRKILVDRIGEREAGIVLVVGAIDAKGRRVVGYGSLAGDDARPLNGDTIFEIGSMTQSIHFLRADGYGAEGRSIGNRSYIKVSASERQDAGTQRQKHHVAGSGDVQFGLPAEPAGKISPWDGYTAGQLYELTRDIGSRFESSNLAAIPALSIAWRSAWTKNECSAEVTCESASIMLTNYLGHKSKVRDSATRSYGTGRASSTPMASIKT